MHLRLHFDADLMLFGIIRVVAGAGSELGQRWRARRRDASVAGPGVRLRDRLRSSCQIALNRLPVFALKASPPLVTGSDAPEPPRRSWVGLRSRGGSGFQRALRVDALKPGS